MKSKYKKLLAVYEKIPSIECKGLCHESCTIAPAAKVEVKRVRDAIGASPFNHAETLRKIKYSNDIDVPSCKALKAGRCSIYRFRPTICRLFGAAKGLECPFGCATKRLLTRDEASLILLEVDSL